MPEAEEFAGRWLVRRQIVDHRGGARYVFEGRALITADRFEEAGVLRTAAGEVPAARAYRLRRAGTVILVQREDGAPFLALDLRDVQPVRHGCGEDRYAGRFLRRDAGCWAEFWRVEGPRKRYSSLTLYRRPPPS